MSGPYALLLALAQVAPIPVAPGDQVLLLIGDAGAPNRRGEPVLMALSRAAAAAPEATTAVFLGDNVYPSGMPAEGHRGRPEAERRLGAQLDAVRIPGLRSIFVPGNHDWSQEASDGWAALRRAEAFVRAKGPAAAQTLPGDGCPGPYRLDLGSQLRLVILDTQWFLHAHARPRHPESSCAADSEEEVEAALRDALATAGGRQVVVAAHHPLATGGPHGGHFSARQHLFPLTDWKPWLWIPLPGIGSAYPAARRAGFSPQDLGSEANQKMRALLERALAERPPLVFASGHDHSLQVIRGTSARYLLVSGAGVYGHTTRVKKLEGSRYAAAKAGFMRLVFRQGQSPKLEVVAVDRAGMGHEGFSMLLE